MPTQADPVGLGGPGERKRLRGDQKFVLRQQVGDLRERLERPAVLAAAGDPRARLAGTEVRNAHNLRRLWRQGNQLADRSLARDVEDGVDRPPGGVPNPFCDAVSVSHRDRTEFPEVLLVAGTRRRDDPCVPRGSHLHGDGTDATGPAVDEEGVTGLHAEQTESAFGGLSSHAGRSRDRPVDRRRLGRPCVEHGVLGLSVHPAAQDVIAR
jgi:hypothetical protein